MDVFLLILVLGIASTYMGFGPVSAKANPKAGAAFVVFGFLLRLFGMLLLMLACVIGYIAISKWIESMPPRRTPDYNHPFAPRGERP